jgi:hypothetical protein
MKGGSASLETELPAKLSATVGCRSNRAVTVVRGVALPDAAARLEQLRGKPGAAQT